MFRVHRLRSRVAKSVRVDNNYGGNDVRNEAAFSCEREISKRAPLVTRSSARRHTSSSVSFNARGEISRGSIARARAASVAGNSKAHSKIATLLRRRNCLSADFLMPMRRATVRRSDQPAILHISSRRVFAVSSRYARLSCFSVNIEFKHCDLERGAQIGRHISRGTARALDHSDCFDPSWPDFDRIALLRALVNAARIIHARF